MKYPDIMLEHVHSGPSKAIALSCNRCFWGFRDLGNILNALDLNSRGEKARQSWNSPEQLPQGLSPEHLKETQETLHNLLERFKLWAANCGAHRVGRMSLDHRLREAMDVHRQVVKLLRDLEDALKEGDQPY